MRKSPFHPEAQDLVSEDPTASVERSADSNDPKEAATNPAASIFNVPKNGRPRPEHHRFNDPPIKSEKGKTKELPTTFKNPFAPRLESSASVQRDPAAVKIPIPAPPAPKPSQPQPPVVYSSLNPTTGAFQPANQHLKAESLAGSEGWWGVYRGEFGEPDPYQYVDPVKANAQIKALFEGAFGDEDEKPRTRRRKKELDRKADQLADKLKKLEVQKEADDKPDDNADADDEEEAEEDESVVEGLAVKLMPHQIVGVRWMKEKELGAKGKGSLSKGGILADDMGLGKTIQALALILSNPRPPLAASGVEGRPKISDSVGKNTLVIAPLALIKQWESEIKTKTDEDRKLRVLVHHGPKRTRRFEDLKRYDVIITTYQTLVSEHDGCSENVQFGCFGIHWYRLVLDEAHSIKNRNAKATKACRALRSRYRWCLTGTPVQNNLDELQSLIAFLKVDPYRELSVWKEQIVQPLSNGRGELAIRRLQAFLKAFMLRRTKRVLTAVDEDDGGLGAGGDKRQNKFKLPARTVEAVTCHLSPAERKFYDALEQKTDQRIEQLMRGTNMNYTSALTLLLRLRQACNHIELVKRAIDKDAATTGLSSQSSGSQTPRKTGVGDVDEMAALLGGLSVATKRCEICLQDLSTNESSSGMIRCSDCQDNLNEQHAGLKKEKQERKSNKALAKKKARAQRTRRLIDDSDDEDDEGEGDWIIPKDQRKSAGLGRAGGSQDENAEGGGEWIGSDDSNTGDESSIVVLGSHKKHSDDSRSLDLSDQDSDNDSDEDATTRSSSNSSQGKPSNLLASTKIKQLIQILQNESHDHKFIVFSQFTTMLDLIEPFLRTARLSFTRYDGSMRNDLREASLDRLRNQPSTRVLLCSLKCGSLGLNLTAASRVVIMEPFWNPFVEEQAIDRVHRLNQTRDVVVYRLTVAVSVEERILELQDRKRALAGAAIEGREVAKLSMKDILNLFKHGEEHDATGHPKPTQPWAAEEVHGGLTANAQGSGVTGKERRKVGPSGRQADDPVYGRRW